MLENAPLHSEETWFVFAPLHAVEEVFLDEDDDCEVGSARTRTVIANGVKTSQTGGH